MLVFLTSIMFMGTIFISVLYCPLVIREVRKAFRNGGLAGLEATIKQSKSRTVKKYFASLVLGSALCFTSSIYLLSKEFPKNPEQEIIRFSKDWASKPANAPLITRNEAVEAIGGILSIFAFVGAPLLVIALIGWGFWVAYHAYLIFTARQMIAPDPIHAGLQDAGPDGHIYKEWADRAQHHKLARSRRRKKGA
jgi:hypothetical protein